MDSSYVRRLLWRDKQPQHRNPPRRRNVAVAKLKISAEGAACLSCHAETTPVLVQQWQASEHSKQSVDCYTCHKANADDPAAFDHYGQKIAVIVTPKYCARCHTAEVDQYEHSRHAKAAQFIGSLDNVLGEVVEGAPAVQSECRQCHGSEVKSLSHGKFASTTWPNSGAGRVNPDGSLGSAQPATDVTLSVWRRPASRRLAENATWARTIRRLRFTTSRCMG